MPTFLVSFTIKAGGRKAGQSRFADPEPAWKADFRRAYGLKEGEVLKRVTAPFPASRADHIKFLKAEFFPRMDFTNSRMSYRWDGKDAEFYSITPQSDRVPLIGLLYCLGIPDQEVEGDENWRREAPLKTV